MPPTEKFEALLVDDEKLSLNLLRQKLERHCPEITIRGAYTDPREVRERLQGYRPDVLFLDIEMPYLSGFDLLREVGDIEFDVIFTTAYDEFAIQALRINALDYLMKPIVVEELTAATKRLRESPRNRDGSFQQFEQLFAWIRQQQSASAKIQIPTLEGIELLEVDHIMYCESSGNYCYLYFDNGDHLLTSKTLKEVERMLPADRFLRIHQSYLVNFDFVQKYLKGGGGYLMLKNGKELKISKYKKDRVLEFIFNLSMDKKT
jgi:two-component system LytT family response regulator